MGDVVVVDGVELDTGSTSNSSPDIFLRIFFHFHVSYGLVAPLSLCGDDLTLVCMSDLY